LSTWSADRDATQPFLPNQRWYSRPKQPGSLAAAAFSTDIFGAGLFGTNEVAIGDFGTADDRRRSFWVREKKLVFGAKFDVDGTAGLDSSEISGF